MDDTRHIQKGNPQQDANCFSKLFFCFFNPFMWKGFRKVLEIEDVYVHLKEDECRLLTNELSKSWQNQIEKAQETKRPPSLARAVLSVYFSKAMVYGALLFTEELSRLLQPLFIGGLVRYFRFDSKMTRDEVMLYALGLVGCSCIYPLIHHQYMYKMYRLGMNVRVACTGLMFNKSLRLSMSALHKTTVGKVVNLMSNDVERFDMSFVFLHYMWMGPLCIIGYGTLLWMQLGPSMLAGFGAILIILPLQGYFSRQMGQCRRKIAVRTDKRVGIMGEILHGIRLIKMYAWEGAFSQLIQHARDREIKNIRLAAIWHSLVFATFWAGGQVVILCAIVAYVYSGNDMTAEKVFVSAALFNGCRLPTTLFFAFGLGMFFEAKVSLSRIQELLLSDEQDKNQKSRPEKIENGPVITEPLLDIKNLSAKWDTGQETPTIRNINFTAKPGQLVAVIGPVGAGKSTLLNTILGETQSTEGQLVCRGSIAYVPQDAWVFTATLRQNVIFGTDYVPRKYQTAIEVCALKKDLRVLPNGDLSLVGDRGITLSGGQKARVNLARAVYRDADIYLFDDPLSAVDAAVGRYLFEKCFKKHLSDKIRILVTHQLQYLQQADIVVLIKDGQMVAAGTFEQLLEMGEEFSDFLQQTEQSYSERASLASPTKTMPDGDISALSPSPSVLRNRKDLNISDSQERDKLLNESADGKLMVAAAKSLNESAWSLALGQAEKVTDLEEEKDTGSVDFNLYLTYLGGMSNALGLFILFVLMITGQIAFNISDWWLNVWTTESERRIFIRDHNLSLPNVTAPPRTRVSHLDIDDFPYIYMGSIALIFVLGIGKSIAMRMGMLNSSKKLHTKMFQAVVRTKVAFFDSNPAGRILNRFTKDMNAVDERLPFTFYDYLSGALTFAAVVLVVGALNPYVFIPTLPLAVLFFLSRYYYLETARDVKRLEATCRSPLYGHVSSSMDGLTTIRAFGAEAPVLDNFYQYQNVHTSAWHAWLTAARWFAVVIDWMVVAFISIVAFVSIYTSSGLTPGAAGLQLMYAVGLMKLFSRFVEQWSKLEIEMVSVERILEYGSLEPEAALESEPDKRPPKDWPKEGAIEMQNVCMKYETSSAFILSDLNFVVQPKAKIGIVGRTGAGKSSLLKVLFRLVQFEGTVKIDAIDCKTIGLHDLRKRISIIPQDPVLFIGSLRKNLDPFEEFTEEQLWKALEQVELKSSVSEMDQGLDTSMAEGGVNLSVGQRQLLCLARAILKHSQILVIDEATANVDLQTDALIQKTLRERFSGSTVLTIAHRLNTIMDSDKIMVLDSGYLKEFDHPHLLLQEDESIFTSLVNETGEQNANLLRSLAEQAHDRNRGSE